MLIVSIVVTLTLSVVMVAGAEARPQDVRSVTGCLQPGANEDAFLLHTEDDTWAVVEAARLNLEGHVNQTVTVTGRIEPEYGVIYAVEVELVADTCDPSPVRGSPSRWPVEVRPDSARDPLARLASGR
jgi:hypothetical protein